MSQFLQPEVHRQSVNDWVDYIQTLHAREIDLDLGRTREVYQRMFPTGIPAQVITVAGTNGKGSTAELVSSIYRTAGYHVGKYTSPHLLKFNERIQINGVDVDDAALLTAFTAVEAARGTTPLTYFEFGTLVAIYLFTTSSVDLMVLEVGLGGRLDAVNILDCDLAIITSISIDHTAWLGNTVEQIAREKAGVVRANRPVVIGETRHDAALLEACSERGAVCYQLFRDFGFVQNEAKSIDSIEPVQQTFDSWSWQSGDTQLLDLPLPFHQAGVQLNNAACVLQALTLLQAVLPVSDQAVNQGIEAARITGRCQIVAKRPWVVLDVAHNEDSVATLNRFVQSLTVQGRVHAVCSMLKDKEIAASLAQIANTVDVWHVASIETERGTTAAHIAGLVSSLCPQMEGCAAVPVLQYVDSVSAFNAALQMADDLDCVVVFGSFYVVTDILATLQAQG